MPGALAKTDPNWKDREIVFRRNCQRLLTEEDTLVLVGDHSWGKTLFRSRKDLKFIMDLPGRKILLRGNHDSFWAEEKTEALNVKYHGKLNFLHENYFAYKEFALVGTKGYCLEGPFTRDETGRLRGWDGVNEEQASTLIRQELIHLRASFEAAKADGYRKFIVFLHYPPTSVSRQSSPFTDIAEEYGAEQVLYAHCHGEANFHNSIEGPFRSIKYTLVSGDCLRWSPHKVLD